MGNHKRTEDKHLLWFDTKSGRLISTIVLVIFVTAFGLLISVVSNVILKIVFCVIAIVSAIIQSVFSIRCAAFDKAREEDVNYAESRLRIYKAMFENVPVILDDSAVGINEIARSIKTTGILQSDRWTLDKSAKSLCESMKRFVKQLCIKGDSVNVYYVRTMDDDGTKVKMIGRANDYGESPKTYRVERQVTEDETAYFDLRMFAKKENHAEFRLTAEEVDRVFYYKDRERESGKYEQFLFVPVVCDENKIIGMVEILLKRGNKLAETEDDMKRIQKLLQIYLSTFGLLTKAEKAAIAIPPV